MIFLDVSYKMVNTFNMYIFGDMNSIVLSIREQFDWRREGGNLPQTSQLDRNRLILYRIRSEDVGRYICVKTEPNGQMTQNYLDVVLKREYRRPRHQRNYTFRWQ